MIVNFSVSQMKAQSAIYTPVTHRTNFNKSQ